MWANLKMRAGGSKVALIHRRTAPVQWWWSEWGTMTWNGPTLAQSRLLLQSQAFATRPPASCGIQCTRIMYGVWPSSVNGRVWRSLRPLTHNNREGYRSVGQSCRYYTKLTQRYTPASREGWMHGCSKTYSLAPCIVCSVDLLTSPKAPHILGDWQQLCPKQCPFPGTRMVGEALYCMDFEEVGITNSKSWIFDGRRLTIIKS